MAKGVLVVQTAPSSSAKAAEYDRWYNEEHIPDVLKIAGFIAARRYKAVETPVLEGMETEGVYLHNLAIYDVEADDLVAAMKELVAAAGSGEMKLSDALQLDPPPPSQMYELFYDSSDAS
jgi:hypothetical protein